MKLKHHKFRFGLIGNLKVLLCRIFGHRVSDDPTGFACQRCRLAYEEIYSPGYWEKLRNWMDSDHLDADDKVYEDEPTIITAHRFGPIDGSEPIGEETPDEYLDRLVKEAAPAWEGVDPEKFLAEVRGRVPVASESGPYIGIRARVKNISEQIDQFIADCGGDARDAVNIALARLELAERKIFESPFDQAIDLLRQLADLQNGPPLQKYREEWEAVMSDVHEFLREHETSTDE